MCLLLGTQREGAGARPLSSWVTSTRMPGGLGAAPSSLLTSPAHPADSGGAAALPQIAPRGRGLGREKRHAALSFHREEPGERICTMIDPFERR